VSTERIAKARSVLHLLAAELGEPPVEVSGEPLEELIATVLSQNTSDVNSHRAYDSLRRAFPRWSRARDAHIDDVIEAIRCGGLAETKAATIQAILRGIGVEDGEPSLSGWLDGDDAADIARLTTFKGVGVKTAACVLLFALGRDICPVDTHVHRVANRLGLVRTASPDATHEALQPLVPPGKAYAFHVLFVRFGRRVCKARTPLCGTCPLYDECEFEDRHVIASASARLRGDAR